MSRIGKKSIIIPTNVEVSFTDGLAKIKGPKGVLNEKIHPLVKVVKAENEIVVSIGNQNSKLEKSLWGTYRQLIANMITGVTMGFEKKLEINGVGYRAEINGRVLVLSLGFSHPINYNLPEGIEAKLEKNVLTISGINKYLVGEVAAQIRRYRKPEPYKGKGIKYATEIIRRKAGKQAKGSEGK